MIQPPPEVIAAARLVEKWAAENNVKNWRVGALASRDELERAAARYDEARKLGTSVYYEGKWGIRRREVRLAEYDRLVDSRIRSDAGVLPIGQLIHLATNHKDQS